MSENNAARALQEWFHEMIQQKRHGFRAGTGGEADGSLLWMYFSRGEAIESRVVLRPGLRDGKPVILVDRIEGESYKLPGAIAKLD
ncbi:MAG: hypothetical protein ACT443_11425 [Gemmatimonadota bacterium]